METHSTLPEKPDSTKPGTKAESFALLASEASLQRFVEEWESGKIAETRVDACRACGNGGILCF